MNEKLPVIDILTQSWNIFSERLKIMLGFTFANFAFLFLGFCITSGFESPFFLLWAILYYLFWTFFFRFYFNRKPYFHTSSLFNSLIPSTKIVFISICFFLILAVLPFIPFFIGMSVSKMETYLDFLQNYMQETKTLDLGLNIILMFISPFIIYRPFMAWIASVLGRSGAIKTAYNKTKNNYWQFVFLSLVMSLPYMILSQIDFIYDINNCIIWLVSSPFIIYFNIVICKVYEYFNPQTA